MIQGSRANSGGVAQGGPPRARTQSGSVLVLVLAVILMLTIAVASMLSMTNSTNRVTGSLEDSTQRVHSVDGALEAAVNEIRNDDALPCPGAVVAQSGYEVECVDLVVGTDPASRTMSLVATDNSGAVRGKARVRVLDEASGQEIVGYGIEVCDWLLGTSVSEEMRGCSSV